MTILNKSSQQLILPQRGTPLKGRKIQVVQSQGQQQKKDEQVFVKSGESVCFAEI